MLQWHLHTHSRSSQTTRFSAKWLDYGLQKTNGSNMTPSKYRTQYGFPLYFVLDFTLKMIFGQITRRHDRATNKMQYKGFFFFKTVNMIARMVNIDKLDKVLWISKSTIVWCAAVLVTRNDNAKTIPANRVKTTRESPPSSDFFCSHFHLHNIFITENKFHD